MAKNITLMGASYSDVPAVNLPQTGGGTARFDDCSVVTATASDVAQGKVFVASDGTVTTGTASGGGGVDMPTFTVTWDAEYTQILSVTCDKTYSEVYDYINNGKVVAIVRETDGEYTAEIVAYFRDYDNFPSDSIKYFVYVDTNEFSYDIVYSNTGTLTAISPSSYYETLNVTANGTYAPSTDYNIINNVNVNVPQPSGSISITQNGTVDVTNYASAVVNVSGGGASNFVTGTFTTPSTTSTNGTIDVPYTGTGYPLALVIYVEGGMYNSAISGWYNSLVRYAVGQYCMTKGTTTVAPSYTGSGSANYGSVQVMYKNSTSSATTYSSTRSANTANAYFDHNATGLAIACVCWRNKTTISYHTAGGTSSTYGLLADTTYRYYAVYSE